MTRDAAELQYPPWIVARKRALRTIGIVLSVSSGLLVVAAAGLTMRTEHAFDESTCRFHPVETRDVAEGVRVEDDARECMRGLVEHRWRVLRGAAAPFEIGRRRLDAAHFARGTWSWTPTLAAGHVHVRVVNRGAGPVTYKEEAQDGRL